MVCEAIVPLELVSNKMQSMSSSLLSVHGRKLLEDSKILHSSAPVTEVTPNFAHERFGSSLVIVIAALFFLIICILGFNTLIRCRLFYRRWRGVSEPSLDMDVERAQTGIQKKDLKALPATVYSTGYPLGALDCPICLAEFIEGEKVRVLPDCCHSFHADCIDAWLVSNASCPSCRHSLLYVLLKKPSGVARPEESAQMDVTERNKSVAANHAQSFHISGDDSTMAASSSLDSIKSAIDLESGNAVETRKT
jgi:E3 ubiquitin-protein ligase ATL10/75/76/77/78